MSIYYMYEFAAGDDIDADLNLDFMSDIMGTKFETAEEAEAALADIYINGQSLAGKSMKEGVNMLRESLDVSSLNTAMRIDRRGYFVPISTDKYISLRYAHNSQAEIELTDELKAEKAQRDNELIEYINNVRVPSDNSIIKVSENEDAREYIKNVTGVESLDDENLQSALDSIYIDGHNLTETLGEDADIDTYAQAVRKALDVKSNSFVTVMKKNNLFSEPTAVLPVLDNYYLVESKKKIGSTMGYVKNYRNSMHNEAQVAEEDFWRKRCLDEKIFFESLFNDKSDPTILADTDLWRTRADIVNMPADKVAAIDPWRMNGSNFCEAVKRLFDNIMVNFVTDRTPENLCYAYMLTRINPKTGKNFTFDEILEDTSADMYRQKALAGKDFCEIFSKVPSSENDAQANIDHFNNVTYPTLLNMTKKLFEVKPTLGDISDRDSIRRDTLSLEKYRIFHDCLQQTEKNSNLKNFINNGAGMATAGTFATSFRLNYLASDNYKDNVIPNGPNMQVGHAAIMQDLIDNMGFDAISGVPLGAVNGEANDAINTYMASLDVMASYLKKDDIVNCINGMPNALDEQLNEEDKKKDMEVIINGFKEAKTIPAEDIVTSAILNYSPAEASINAKGVPNIQLKKLQNFYMDIPAAKGNLPGVPDAVKNCDGLRMSIINELTSCPVTKDTDKSMFNAAFEKVYINTMPLKEYYNIQGDVDYDTVKKIEKDLTEKVLKSVENNGPEFVSIKYGKNDFRAVNVMPDSFLREREPQKDKFKSAEEYNNALKRYQLNTYEFDRNEKRNAVLKSGNETAAAYAKLISATANYNELKECSELLASRGVKAPGAYIDALSVQSLASENNYEGLIKTFMGTENVSDALNMADRLIINGKAISENPAFINASDEHKKIEAMGSLIKKAFEDNLSPDGWVKPIMMVNNKGDKEPVKFTMTDPQKPQPVEQLKGVSRMFSLPSTRTAADKAYDDYLKAMDSYKSAEAFMDRIKAYNVEADLMRTDYVRRSRGTEPAAKVMNINEIEQEAHHVKNHVLTEFSHENTMQSPELHSDMGMK